MHRIKVFKNIYYFSRWFFKNQDNNIRVEFYKIYSYNNNRYFVIMKHLNVNNTWALNEV